MKKALSLFVLFVVVAPASAAEIDSYSGTDQHIWSATKPINRDINSRLQNTVNKLNKEKISCPENIQEAEDVYSITQDAIMKNINIFFVGHFIAEHFHETLADDEKIVIPFEKSIYNDISFIEGISLWLKGTLGIIKVNGNFHMFGANYIGVDKLGHFFAEGYSFYEKAYIEENSSIDKAIEWGKETERGKYGLVTTGVFSHADLVANFNGMRFWNQLLLLEQDAFNDSSYSRKSFFTCSNKTWKLNKKFNIDEFTDSAWDERINCNDYKDEDIQLKILKGFEKAEDADSWEGFCPAIPSRCDDAKEKYSRYSNLIHPHCLNQN